MKRIDLYILRCYEQCSHSSKLQVPRWKTVDLRIIESVHQINSLEEDTPVFNVHLSTHLKKPVNHCCSQLTRDMRLVSHEGHEARLILPLNHVIVRLSPVVSEKESIMLLQQESESRNLHSFLWH